MDVYNWADRCNHSTRVAAYVSDVVLSNWKYHVVGPRNVISGIGPSWSRRGVDVNE